MQTSLPLPKDTLNTQWNALEYVAGQQFFETFAFRPSQGRTLQELSDYLCREHEYIMTEDLLQVGWGDTDPRGKFLPWITNGDTNYIEVPGAIGPIKKRLDEKPRPFLIRSMDPAQIAWRVSSSMQVALRLKDGVSMTRFLHDFQPWMLEHLKAGNLYANKVQSSTSAWAWRAPSGCRPAHGGRRWAYTSVSARRPAASGRCSCWRALCW